MFRHSLRVFCDELEHLVQERAPIEALFRPGVIGLPVLNTHGSVFWRPDHILHAAAHARADRLMSELYHSFVRSRPYRAEVEEHEPHAILVLMMYAVWRGCDEWIYSMASLFLQTGWRNGAEQRVMEVATLLALVQGRTLIANLYYKAVEPLQPGPYFEYCFHRLAGRADRTSLDGPRAEGDVSVKRLMLAEAAATRDRETERYLFRRMLKNPPVDENDLLDLYATLLCRGRLFRAARLILRHCRICGERPHLMHLVLRLYFENGKYLAYLRRLAALGELPARENWFEAVFAIYRLSQKQRLEELMEDVLANKPDALLPVHEKQFRFLHALEAADTGEHAPRYVDQGEELVLKHYLLRTFEQRDSGGEELRERYGLFQELAIEVDDEDRVDVDRLQVFFVSLRTLFRTHALHTESPRLYCYLESLCGRNLRMRLFLGLYAFDREWHDQAAELLDNLAGSDPGLQHARSELAAERGEFARAAHIYRNLIASRPPSALLLFNLGLIYERAREHRRAMETYQQVLELDPGMLEARDRITLLR